MWNYYNIQTSLWSVEFETFSIIWLPQSVSACIENRVFIRAVEVPKKRLVKRLLLQAPFKAPIHSKYCNRGFSETGLALVVVLRCDWPLCDLRFKSYEHFKLKIFISVHTAGTGFFSQNLQNNPPKMHLSTFPHLPYHKHFAQYNIFGINSPQFSSLPAAGVELLILKSMPC